MSLFTVEQKRQLTICFGSAFLAFVLSRAIAFVLVPTAMAGVFVMMMQIIKKGHNKNIEKLRMMVLCIAFGSLSAAYILLLLLPRMCAEFNQLNHYCPPETMLQLLQQY